MAKDYLSEFANFLSEKENIVLTGLAGNAKYYLINNLSKTLATRILCLVADEEKAYDLANALNGAGNNDRVHLFLSRDLLFLKENYAKKDAERVLILHNLVDKPKRREFIILTPSALLHQLMTPQEMKNRTIKVEAGQEIDLQKLLIDLVNNDYKRIDTVTRPGEFAVRGGIVDIFPLSHKVPFRIDFFGDYIESIRSFDCSSQRTTGTINHFHICPADELNGSSKKGTILDYCKNDTMIFFDEPREFYNNWAKVKKRFEEVLKETKKTKGFGQEPSFYLADSEAFRQQLQAYPVVFSSFFPGNIPQVSYKLIENISQKEMESFQQQYESMFSRIKEWNKSGYQVKIAVKNKLASAELSRDLIDHHISNAEFINENWTKGFVSSTLRIVLITENDIWGKTRASKKKNKHAKEQLLLEDLKIGDFVVHEQHGIGIFQGITQVESDGVIKEYVALQYAGTDKLYLPIDRLDSLFRFSITDDKEPRLNKLGGTEWERTKNKVAQSIQEMAQEMLLRYVKRQSLQGYGFSADSPWQSQFESDFPYTETPDQIKAIRDVKADMESIRPMERLICGDVGYGKTEIAMRAAFKAMMDGKQIAVLVPTTVLAEQHYQTFKARFSSFPCVVECLSRFRTTAQQKRIIADLQKGAIDIIIGTHRLLSKDIVFKDIGLLVIDEEHRFGVAQKEHLLALKELVDVISLSATPIPRSLHMSLSGLRDMSVINTPPPGRYPISTYVLEYNEEVIKEAIMNEIERGGQVYFVHNRIQDIARIKNELAEICPGVSIEIGHGRLSEDQLARIMLDFAQGKFQVFLCTTIIESGLDIPNVNTIIVDEADKMGLAQLYQLRGRVGRSDRLAYAYLTYRPFRSINENAQKRLWAIREFSDLGSGMKIAMRDLEIRGFGNILGSEQHGYIQAIGFDLYCHLLEREASRLKGTFHEEKASPLLDLDVDTYIPDSYITDSGTKMRFYRRLLMAADIGEIESIQAELVDRFGKMPEPAENFLNIALLRVLAKEKEIISLRGRDRYFEIKLSKPIVYEKINQAEIKGVKASRANTLQLSKNSCTLEDLKKLLSVI